VTLLVFVVHQAFGKVQVGAFIAFRLAEQGGQLFGNARQAQTAVFTGNTVNG